MAYGYIYRITNVVNGKVYIGQSADVQKSEAKNTCGGYHWMYYDEYLENPPMKGVR